MTQPKQEVEETCNIQDTTKPCCHDNINVLAGEEGRMERCFLLSPVRHPGGLLGCVCHRKLVLSMMLGGDAADLRVAALLSPLGLVFKASWFPLMAASRRDLT